MHDQLAAACAVPLRRPPSRCRCREAAHVTACVPGHGAAQVLTTLYECLTEVKGLQAGATGRPLVDDIFGLHLSEHVYCKRCHKTSHTVEAHVEHSIILSPAAMRVYLAGAQDGFDRHARTRMGE